MALEAVGMPCQPLRLGVAWQLDSPGAHPGHLPAFGARCPLPFYQPHLADGLVRSWMEKILVHSQAESGVFPLTDPKLMRQTM